MSVRSAEKLAPRDLEVPLLDLKAQYRQIEAEVREALDEVCAAQRFILGPSVKLLEDRIAAYSRCRYGIGVSSGTDALLAALMALDVGPGDEVITTPYSFFATGGVVARLGARPVFCDIDPHTYNLSPGAVADVIKEHFRPSNGVLIDRKTGARARVLVAVHLFGQVADMNPLMELAKANNLKVIEDAAQAIGAEYVAGARAGSIGDIGCFSFFPSKNLGAFGDAGMCTTNDPALAERLRILRVHGAEPKYHHALIGGNFRLDEIQAAVLLVKLRYLDAWTEKRQENARYYDEAFTAEGVARHVSRPHASPGQRHIYNQYVIRAARRDELQRHLRNARIGTEVYYPVPLHLQECFASLGYRRGDCPQAERAAAETLALPIYPELTDAQQGHVARTISEFYGSSPDYS